VCPARAALRVIAVKSIDHGLEDGDVDWVHSSGRTVLLAESIVEFCKEWELIGRCAARGLLGVPRVGSTQKDGLVAHRANFLRCD
jgi:hypothetical protein